MIALLIGGSGFVGRNLTNHLEQQGHEVVILDRVPDSTHSFSGTFIQADAQNPKILSSVLADLGPSVVYHLAANSDISAGSKDASLDFGDTLMTTTSIRAAVVNSPITRLVFASSSAIFGDSHHALTEEPEFLPDPQSWYGKAKLASEYVLESLSSVRPDLPILFVRFPNVVGPLATHGVVFDFVRKLRTDPTRLDVLGDGFQTKPYVHVSDLIAGIQHFEQSQAMGVTKINIGPPDLIDVRGIAGEVCRALDVHPVIAYQDSPIGWPGDVPRYEFDTTKMEQSGFHIRTTSREAVRRAAAELALEWPV